MTTVDILRKARGIYAECPSHAPANTFPAFGTACVVIAFDRALRGDRSGHSADHYRDAENAFAAAIHGTPADIVKFNADHSTEEVLTAFDKAIEMAA